MMRKIMLTSVLSIGLILSGCSSASSETTISKTDEITIGIVQLVEHPALNQIQYGIVDGLAEKGYENVIVKNAQNDMSNINTIVQEFISSEVDMLIPITTQSAQSAVALTSEIPIIFSGVTDPVNAGLVDNLEASGTNVTGVRENIDVVQVFELAKELTPDVTSFGLVYNLSEENSIITTNEAKAYMDANGLSYKEATVTSTNEIQQATTSLVGEVDALFIPNDNTVASAMPVVAQVAIENNMPIYATADSLVNDGGLATVGVDYYELGLLTADVAEEVLLGTDPGTIPVGQIEKLRPVVNEEVAEKLSIDVSAYAEK